MAKSYSIGIGDSSLPLPQENTTEYRAIDTDTGEIIAMSEAERAQLSQHEQVIERGLKTFTEVGNALLAIRDGRLYRAAYKTFEAYCQERWGFVRRQADRLIEAATAVENLRPMGLELPENERQMRPLVELAPDEQRLVWEVVTKTAPNGRITGAHVKSVTEVLKEVTRTRALDDGSGIAVDVADAFKAAVTEETYERLKRQEAYIEEKQARRENGGVPPALQMSESNEWYTPQDYIEAARRVLGAIDLDPASNPFANQTVKASRFFTIIDDGLKQQWRGRVWLNPPYGRDSGESNQAIWSARLIEEYEAGRVTEAVLLINAVTDRVWFQPLWNYPICFTDHRIKFYDPSGEAGSPTHGNALVYFGSNKQQFVDEFTRFGAVVVTVARRALEIGRAA